MSERPEEIQSKIEKIEAMRSELGDAAANAAITALRSQISTVQENVQVTGTIYGPAVGVNIGQIIYRRHPHEHEQHEIIRYLEMLAAQLKTLPLKGLATELDQSGKGIAMPNVYIMLATTRRVRVGEGEEETIRRYFEEKSDILQLEYHPDYALPIDALYLSSTNGRQSFVIERSLLATEAIFQNKQLVLLGGPGSGKSTFLRYLAWAHAQRGLEQPQESSALPGLDASERLLPVLLPLRALAKQLAENGVSERTVRQALQAEMQRYDMGDTNILLEALHKGAVLLLFDGLDEIPLDTTSSTVDRITTLQAVRSFTILYPKALAIVTCRTRAFTENMRGSLGWQVEELAPFTLGQIRHFVHAWFSEWAAKYSLADKQAAQLGETLVYTLDQNPRLRQMAETPLLLTMIALVLYNQGELPQDRPYLYENILSSLLGSWDRGKGELGLTELLGYPDWSVDFIHPLLDKLAYEAHTTATSFDGRGLLNRHKILDELHNFFRDAQVPVSEVDRKAILLLEYIEQRSGLVLSVDADNYSFVHLSLQEYCAGRYIAFSSENPVALVMHHRNDDRWREPIFLAMGVADLRDLNDLLTELIERDESGQSKTIAQWYRDLILTAEIGSDRDWNYLRARRRIKVDRLLSSLRSGLVTLLNDMNQPLSEAERIQAGFLLGDIGDPRFPTKIEEWKREWERAMSDSPNSYFCKIEAGSYIIGSNDDDPDAQNDEKPQHTITFEEPFWITRYPITNAQWQAWLHTGEQSIPLIKENDTTHPNQPIVGINWNQCDAFCKWLSDELENVIVRLPKEDEWEATARGKDARRYPWGTSWQSDRAIVEIENVGETLDSTRSSPIGCYPAGMSPYGAFDMAGNIWEWTESKWQSYPGAESPFLKEDLRVIKGGSRETTRVDARCATRKSMHINTTYNPYIGFRVVIVPAWQEWEQQIRSCLLRYGETKPEELQKIPANYRAQALRRYAETYESIQSLEDYTGYSLRLLNGELLQRWQEAWKVTQKALGKSPGIAQKGRAAVHQLAEIFSEALGFNIKQNRDYQGMCAYMVEAPALHLNLPKCFPLVFLADPSPGQHTVQTLVDTIDVLRETGYFTLVVVMGHPTRTIAITEKLRYAIKQSPHVQDFIVINQDNVLDILIARKPDQELAKHIVEQVDLSVISPFVISGPVPETMFFGREAEIRLLVEQAGKADFAIIGNRKIGKTSLLKRVGNRLVDSRDVQPISINCQTARNNSAFFVLFQKAIEWKHPPETPGQFAAAIQELRLKGKIPVLLLDEVDELLANDYAHGEPLAAEWRTLAQDGVCRFIFCGCTTLALQMQNSGSSFFNFPQSLPLGYLSPKTAGMVLKQPLEALRVVLEDEQTIVEGVLELTSGHPNLVQYLGKELVHAANRRHERRILVSDLEQVKRSNTFHEYYRSTILGEAEKDSHSLALELLITLVAPPDGFRSRDIKTILESHGVEPTYRRLTQALKLLCIFSILEETDKTYTFVPRNFYDMQHCSQDVELLIAQAKEDWMEAKA